MKETYEEKINRRLGVKQRIIAVASGREKAESLYLKTQCISMCFQMNFCRAT